MPRGKSSFGFASQLSKMVDKLKEQRRKHADALRSLDEIFERIGITTHLAEVQAPRRGRPPGKRGPGRPPGSGAAGPAKSGRRRRRGRGSYATTAGESILTFVKAGGAKGRTSTEINKHWETEGRSSSVYNALGELVKTRKLKRHNIEGARGSRYTA